MQRHGRKSHSGREQATCIRYGAQQKGVDPKCGAKRSLVQYMGLVLSATAVDTVTKEKKKNSSRKVEMRKRVDKVSHK